MGLLDRIRRRPSPDATITAATSEALSRIEERFESLERVIAHSPAPGTSGAELTPDHPLYAHDYPWRWYTPQSPRRRPESTVTLDDLRRLADVWDVARSCIQHLKREVTAVPMKIVARDDKAKGAEERIEQARQWFERSGGLGGRGRRRQQYEGVLIEDLCVVGAACVWFRSARNGRPYEVFPIDAATIRPRVDNFGWPMSDGVVWEQWIEGNLIRGFTRQEMQFDGLWPTSYSPYPKSPTEWVILCAQTALAADQWDREWLVNGSMPAEMIAVPEHWKPGDVKAYAQWWNDTLSGDIRGRQMPKFVPSGMNKLMNPSRHDQEFSELSHWLMQRACSLYGVQPSSIGYMEQQYKVSQEGSFDQTSAFGAGVLLEWRKDHYDDLLERIGFPDLETQNVTDVEEDAGARTERLTKACGTPYMTPNEARAEDGKEGIEGGEKLFVPATMVPADELLAQSELATASSEQQLEAGEMQMTPGFGSGEDGDGGGGPGGNGSPGGPAPTSGPPTGMKRAYSGTDDPDGLFGMAWSEIENEEAPEIEAARAELEEYLRAAAPAAGKAKGGAGGKGGTGLDGHWVTIDGKPVFIPAGTAQNVHALRQQARKNVGEKHAATAQAIEKNSKERAPSSLEVNKEEVQTLRGLPEVSREQAEAAIQGSIFTQDFFHSTSMESGKAIRSSGYDLKNQSAGTATAGMLGAGVYLTDVEALSTGYGTHRIINKVLTRKNLDWTRDRSRQSMDVLKGELMDPLLELSGDERAVSHLMKQPVPGREKLTYGDVLGEYSQEQLEKYAKIKASYPPGSGRAALGDAFVKRQVWQDLGYDSVTSTIPGLGIHEIAVFDPRHVFAMREETETSSGDEKARSMSSAEEELARWERKARNRLRDRGHAAAPWNSDVLSEDLIRTVFAALTSADDPEAIRVIFARARESLSFPQDDTESRRHFAHRWQQRRRQAEENPLDAEPLFDADLAEGGETAP